MATYSANLNSSGSLKLNVNVTEGAFNSSSNTRIVTANVTITGSGGGAWSNNATSGYLVINGQRTNFTLPSYNFGSSVSVTLLSTQTYTVSYNSDGTGSVNIYAYYNPSNPSWLQAGTVSATMPLTSVSRADQVSVSDVKLGQTTIPFTVTQSYGAATKYVIRIGVGADSFDIETSPSARSVTPSPSQWAKLYSQFKSTYSNTFALVLFSHNASGLIGSSTSYATMSIDSGSSDPVISTPSLGSHLVDTTAGVTNKLGYQFLRGYSNLRFAFPSVTFTYGATGVTYNTTVTNSSGSILFQSYETSGNFTIWESGTMTLKFTVTDSRGSTSTPKSLQFTVLPYYSPQISYFYGGRVDGSGQSSLVGTTAKLTFSASVSSVYSGGEKNNLIYKIEDITNGSVLKSGPTSQGGLSTGQKTINITGLSVSSNYSYKLTITDAFGNSSSSIVSITISKVTQTWGSSGVACGGVYNEGLASGKGLQVYDTAYFDKPIYMNEGFVSKPINNSYDDLNNYIQPGFYNTGSDAVARTLQNCPTSYSFSLFVEKTAGIKQTLTEYLPYAPRTWIRTYYNGTFSDWLEVRTVYQRSGDYENGYIRYTDGMQECFKKVTYNNVTFPNSFSSSGWYSNATSLGAWPMSFASTAMTVTMSYLTTTALSTCEFSSNWTTTTAPNSM